MTRWRDTAAAVLAVGLISGPPVQAADDRPTATTTPAVPATATAPGSPAAAQVVSGTPGGSAPITTLLDGGWNTGFYTSTLVDRDDTTHVAYYADGTGSVRLASCDEPCVEPRISVLTDRPGIGVDLTRVGHQLVASFLDLDTRTVQLVSCALPDCDAPRVDPVAAVTGLGPTHLDVTPDGDLVLAYPGSGQGLTVAWCDGTDCRRPAQHELGGIADHSDLAVDTEGRVWVAHRDGDDHVLVVRCSTASNCTTLGRGAVAAAFPSIAVSPSGVPAISYHGVSRHDLHLLTCLDPAGCRDVVIDASGDVGYFSSVVWRPDGPPLVAHRSESPAGLVVADCQDVSCRAVAHRPVDLRGEPGEHLSVVVARDGRPRIAHHDALSRTLRLTSCADVTCASPPGAEHGGESISVAVGPDGGPVVAWRHPETMDLRLSSCVVGVCTASIAVDSGGDVGLQASVSVGSTTRVVHRDAGSGGLRVVTCDDGCREPEVNAVEAPAPVAWLSPHIIAGTVPVFAATTIGGTVLAAHCGDPSCGDVSWRTVADGRAGGPVAVTSLADGRAAFVHTDDLGAAVTLCDTYCRTRVLATGTVTSVDVTAVGRELTAVARHADGRVTVGRCTATCLRIDTETLTGTYDHVASSGAGSHVTVAVAQATGTVTVFDCTTACVEDASFASGEAVRQLDVLRDGDRDVVALLGAQGPTVVACGPNGCVTEDAGEQPRNDRAPSIAGQQ